jgi:hypothetical protein
MTTTNPPSDGVISICEWELLALKKLALVCRALGERLGNYRAEAEQKALTSVLVEVIARAELANATPPRAALARASGEAS